MVFFIFAFSVPVNGQTEQKYVTLDQWKEIQFLDSNKIILREGFVLEIKGTYKRKIGRLIVYPTSITGSSKNKFSDPIPAEIMYQVKKASGQKFELKKLDDPVNWDTYYLSQRISSYCCLNERSNATIRYETDNSCCGRTPKN